jgi:hypothetical protein
VPTLQGTTQTLTTTLQWQRLPKPHQSTTPWKLSVEALGTQARLGVGQRSTRRLRECNRDPPLKKIVSKTRMSTNVLSKSNPTHGRAYKAESCIGYNKDRVKVHFANLPMQGFISKRFSQIIFITKVTQLF